MIHIFFKHTKFTEYHKLKFGNKFFSLKDISIFEKIKSISTEAMPLCRTFLPFKQVISFVKEWVSVKNIFLCQLFLQKRFKF